MGVRDKKNIRETLIYWGDRLYYRLLEKELRSMKTVLDVGCGWKSPLGKIKKTFYSTGVDIFEASIKKGKKKKIHDAYIIGSALDIDSLFNKQSFDAVVALDLVEHLDKKDGFLLLKKMEIVSRKKIIILVPNGFHHQEPFEGNPYQVHRSGWNVDDFTRLGYTVYGLRGLKYLRGESAVIKYKPWIVWGLLSAGSQYPLLYFPRFSYQLFAIKEL